MRVRDRGRRAAPGRRRPARVRAQERARHRCRRRAAGARALGLRLAQPQGAAARPHRARERRARSRRACRCSTARTARSRSSSRRRPRRPRASAPSRRPLRGTPEAPAPRRGRRARWSARAHRSRQGAVGGVRARAPARACQRLPARGRAQVGHRRHRQRRPQEHLARAASSTSISTTGAAAARSPAAPRSSRSPGPGRSTSAPTSTRTPRPCSSPSPCRAWCRAGWRARCRSWPALESFDVPVWGEAQLDLSSAGEILSGTIGIDAAPGQVLLPWLAATPLRIDGGHLALSYSRADAPLRDRALGAGLGRQPRAVHRQHRRTRTQGAGRARLGLRPQVGRRLARRRAAAPAAADDRRLVGARLLCARARPRRAQPVQAARRRRARCPPKAT